jgi:histone-lysine N-methyltransferase SETD2
MNAVGQVFPDASPLICRYHVIKNVNAKCKALCKIQDGDEMIHSDVMDMVTKSFVAVLDAPTKESYAQAVVEFRKVCEKWPIFRNYVQNTILDTDETKVAKAWTNEIMHFGNTATIRAEGAHGVLKKYFPDGNGDFLKVWEAIEKMLTSQFSGIKTSFGQSLSVEEHRYVEHNNFLYALIKFKISRTALDFIFYEAKRVVDCGSDPKSVDALLEKHMACRVHVLLPRRFATGVRLNLMR